MLVKKKMVMLSLIMQEHSSRKLMKNYPFIVVYEVNGQKPRSLLHLSFAGAYYISKSNDLRMSMFVSSCFPLYTYLKYQLLCIP